VKKTGFLLSDLVFPAGQTQFGPAPLFLLASFSVDNFSVAWVGSDGFVSFFVHSFQRFTVNAVFNVLTELLAVSFFVVFFEFVHVLGDITTEDVFAVGFGVEVVLFVVVAWEPFGGVWDVETAVDGAFEGSEDFVSGGGSGETGVEEASEWTWTFFVWFDVVFVSVNFGLADVG